MEKYMSPAQISQSLTDPQIHESIYCCTSLRFCGCLLCINTQGIYHVFSFICLHISPFIDDGLNIKIQNLPSWMDRCPWFHLLKIGCWLNFLFRSVTIQYSWLLIQILAANKLHHLTLFCGTHGILFHPLTVF